MLLLGVLAAQAEAAAPAGILAYDFLTGTDGGGNNSLTFSSLVSAYAADYDHLEFRATLRSETETGFKNLRMWFNGVGPTGNTSYHAWSLFGNASTVTQASGLSKGEFQWQSGEVENNTTPAVGAARILILDAFNTTKRKQVQMLSGLNEAGDRMNVHSGIYDSTAAIDQIQFRNSSGAFSTNTRFSLFGIKVA